MAGRFSARVTVHYGGTWHLVHRRGRWWIEEIQSAGWRMGQEAAEAWLKRLVDTGKAVTLLDEEAEKAAEKAAERARMVLCDHCRLRPPATRAPTGRGLWCLECVGAVEPNTNTNTNTNNNHEEDMDAETIRSRLEGVPPKDGRLYTDEYKIAVADLVEEAAEAGVTQSEIGAALDLSQAEVSRLKRSGVKLKRWKELTPDPAPQPNGDASKNDVEALMSELVELRSCLEDELEQKSKLEHKVKALEGALSDVQIERDKALEGQDAQPPVRVELLLARAEKARRRATEAEQELEAVRAELSQARLAQGRAEGQLEGWELTKASLEAELEVQRALAGGLPDEIHDLACDQLGLFEEARTQATPAVLIDGLVCLVHDLQAPRCLHCGCTDDRGCPEGCWWVEEGLCSSCAARLEVQSDERVNALLALMDAREKVAVAEERAAAAEQRLDEAIERATVEAVPEIDRLRTGQRNEQGRRRNAKQRLEEAVSRCKALGVEVRGE